ncbi:MAG: PDZ domain-containing protein, partial [Oscillospiraceae bacterium]|nr:PDZ domain-containing protein [Oscillospiraceae bacterium]
AQYYTAKEYTDLLNKLEGTKIGIGLEISKDGSGYIKIDKVYDNSPAFESGIMPEDLIIEVNEKSVTSGTFEEIATSLEGEVGTTVKLKTRRGAEENDYEITRRKYELPSVFSKMIENSDIGYIKITEFRDATTTQFIKAVDALIASGANGLIFDVRDNGGGTLDSATAMLDYLLPEGDIISVTNKSGATTVMATSDAYEIDLPMVVLINEKTASAAELFAQALMDYEKASSVGTTTYGKGVMQTIIKLSDGSAINITTAAYNPPKSGNYDGIGVKPNFEVKMAADSLTDTQLAKAKDVIEAIKVKEGIITTTPSSSSEEAEEDTSSEEETSEESSSSSK